MNKINQIDPIFLPKEDRGANEPIELRIITTTSESALFAPSRDISIEESESNGAINNERKTLADLSLEIASLEARLAKKQQPDSKKSRVLILTSASTLAADNAEYVHQWRNRVETVGNIHYPREARANQLYGAVRLLVKLQASGIVEESAYYESLHELPLIANTVARKKLFEMNRIISDTAEYGCYLFDHACKPLLVDFMKTVKTDVIGLAYSSETNAVDNATLISVNQVIRTHSIESIGSTLRQAMTDMKVIKTEA